jgi:hypothetical protein
MHQRAVSPAQRGISLSRVERLVSRIRSAIATFFQNRQHDDLAGAIERVCRITMEVGGINSRSIVHCAHQVAQPLTANHLRNDSATSTRGN